MRFHQMIKCPVVFAGTPFKYPVRTRIQQNLDSFQPNFQSWSAKRLAFIRSCWSWNLPAHRSRHLFDVFNPLTISFGFFLLTSRHNHGFAWVFWVVYFWTFRVVALRWWQSFRQLKPLKSGLATLTNLILSYQENYPWVPIQPHTLAKESLMGNNSLL